ncbi:MAG: TOMM precursor leader peptide-binding protein [Oscillatoriaceae cyanobacterium]
MKQPIFKHCFRCEIVKEGVFLISETEQFLLQGEGYIKLAPLLNGQHRVGEIINILQEQLSAEEVYYLLDRLQTKGYIIDGSISMPSEEAAFWQMLGTTPEMAAKRLDELTVSVVAWGDIDPEPFQTILTSLGVKVGEEGDLSVVLTDDYLQAGLEAYNRECWRRGESGGSWMLVKPTGIEVWIGPLFIPGETGCWECLAQRLRGHRKLDRYIQGQQNTRHSLPTSLAALPSTRATALAIAATETAKWIALSHDKTLAGNILTINNISWEQRHHRLVRRPQCACCGNASAVSNLHSTPLVLSSRPKYFTHDGGYRSLSPEQTFKQLEHHISPITGIVGVLQRTSTWEVQTRLTPSYRAGYASLEAIDNLEALQENLRTEAYGKGKSDAQAKVSALCEALERYAAIFQGDEARIKARFPDLKTAIHPNACMLFSPSQLANRKPFNGGSLRFDWIPEPFDENAEIEWTPAWSLTSGDCHYVPTAYCYSGYAQKHQAWFARADSNGCAAGSNLEEAILQGLMELVERDSIAIWWYNRLHKPPVDLASFDEPYFQEIYTYYQQLQRDIWVLDITSDLNIPAFVAISRSQDTAAENILLGFGAHFDPRIALLRAISELNQSLPAAFFGIIPVDRAYRDRDPEAIQWWHTATCADHPYLLPDPTAAAKTIRDYPQTSSDDIYTDVMMAVSILQKKGMTTLVVNQTRPDLDLYAVKVIVPGLRHFWPRFAPDRLYDVPVQMGWLPQPLTEDQLNPLPAFF